MGGNPELISSGITKPAWPPERGDLTRVERVGPRATGPRELKGRRRRPSGDARGAHRGGGTSASNAARPPLSRSRDWSPAPPCRSLLEDAYGCAARLWSLSWLLGPPWDPAQSGIPILNLAGLCRSFGCGDTQPTIPSLGCTDMRRAALQPRGEEAMDETDYLQTLRQGAAMRASPA
jgi:hypothetical protein